MSNQIEPVATGPLGELTIDARVVEEDLEMLPNITKFTSDWIDFGATGVKEVYQNVKYIILTPIRSVVLDREFGMDFVMVDKPIPIAKLMLTQEVAMKVALYEQRCFFEEVEYREDHLQGWLKPNVRIVITSTKELDSMYSYPEGGTAVSYIKPYIRLMNPDLLQGPIIAIGQPGPPGPEGPPGAPGEPGESAWTILDAAFTVPDVGQQTDILVDFADWMAVGEWVYIEGAGTGGEAAALKIMAINGTTITVENVLYTIATGPPGPPGSDGINGVNGAPGSKWYDGPNNPVTIPGAIAGDYYLNTTTGEVFLFS